MRHDAERDWKAPRWLYPASIGWGVLAGAFAAAAARRENLLAPDFVVTRTWLEALLAPEVAAVGACGGLYCAVLFGLLLPRAHRPSFPVWGFPLAPAAPLAVSLRLNAGWQIAAEAQLIPRTSWPMVSALLGVCAGLGAALLLGIVSGLGFYGLVRLGERARTRP